MNLLLRLLNPAPVSPVNRFSAQLHQAAFLTPGNKKTISIPGKSLASGKMLPSKLSCFLLESQPGFL